MPPSYDPLHECLQGYASAAGEQPPVGRQPLRHLSAVSNQNYGPTSFSLQYNMYHGQTHTTTPQLHSSSLYNAAPSTWPYQNTAFPSVMQSAPNDGRTGWDRYFEETPRQNPGWTSSRQSSPTNLTDYSTEFTWPHPINHDASLLATSKSPPRLPAPSSFNSPQPHRRSPTPLLPALEPRTASAASAESPGAHRSPSPPTLQPQTAESNAISPQSPRSPARRQASSHVALPDESATHLSRNEEEDDTEARKVAWAVTNNGRPVIPSRSHPVTHQKPTRAERRIRLEVNRAKQEALTDDIEALRLKLDEGLKKIAEDHSKTLSSVRNLFFYNHRNKYCAEPSLGNALVSYKAEQLNEGGFQCYAYILLILCTGKDEGYKARLSEIREAVRNDPELQNLSKTEEKELRERLMQKRGLKRTGIRPSFTAASLDIRKTVSEIRELVCVQLLISCTNNFPRCSVFANEPVSLGSRSLRVRVLRTRFQRNMLIMRIRLSGSSASCSPQ